MNASLVTTGTPIETLKLSARPLNALIRAGVDTVEHLCKHSRESLALLRGIGESVLAEIENALTARGLALRDDDQPIPEAAPEVPAGDQPEEQPQIDFPFKDIREDDPKRDGKRLANTLAHALATNRVPTEKRAEAERSLKQWIEEFEAPEGYYPWSAVHNANPVNKLTHDERIQCIRSLPLEIVNKLFPNL